MKIEDVYGSDKQLFFLDEDLNPVKVEKIEKVPYEGKIYDVTVKNHIILIKRKGKAVWSGNSYNLVNSTVTGQSGTFTVTLGVHDDGSYNITATSYDNASNSNTTSVTVTVDTMPPNVTLISPVDHYNTSSILINFTFNVTDNIAGTLNCSLYINDEAITYNDSTVNGTNTTFSDITVNIGKNQNWTVKCSDSANNTHQPSVRIFNVDRGEPAIAFVSPTDDDGVNVGRNWTYVNVTVVNGATDIVACLLEWNGVNESMTKEGSGSSVFCYKNKSDAEGTYSYKVYANDSAGNWNVSETRSITFDVTKPTIWNVSLSSTGILVNTSIQISANVTDNVNVSLVWASIMKPDGEENIILNPNSLYENTFANTSLTGIYNVTVYANDTAGNLNSSNVSFTVASCIVDSDCGTDGYVGSNYCYLNDVYRKYRTYTCSNPGTVSASCGYSDSDSLIEDCGDNYIYYGSNYCSGNNVVRDVTLIIRGCDPSTVSCYSQIGSEGTEVVEVCGEGYICSGGECIAASLNITMDLNRTEVMRGWSVRANGSVEGGITCSECLNVSWGSTTHSIDVVNGLWTDSYIVEEDDESMTVVAKVEYEGEIGIASEELIVNSSYLVMVNCDKDVLSGYEEQVCNASVLDIDMNPVSSGITVEFSLNGDSYIDTEAPYLWSFSVPAENGNYTVKARAYDSWNNSGSGSDGFCVYGIGISLSKVILVWNNQWVWESSDIVFPFDHTGRFRSNITVEVLNVTDEEGIQKEANVSIQVLKPNDSLLYSTENEGYPYRYNFILEGIVPEDSGNYTVRVNASLETGDSILREIVIPVSFWRIKIDYDVRSYLRGEVIPFNISTWFNGSLKDAPDIEAQIKDTSANPQGYRYYPEDIRRVSTGRYVGNLSTYDLGEDTYFLYAKILGSKLAEDKNQDIKIESPEGPLIYGLMETDPLEYGSEQNVSVNVSDEDGLALVLIEFNGVNHTMNPGYWYSWIPEEAPGETVVYRIYAKDSLGNWNSVIGSFIIQDTTKPEIISYEIEPSIVTLGEQIIISATVTDNYQVDKKWLIVTKPSNDLVIFYFTDSVAYTADELGGYTVTVYANDTSGNTANRSLSFIALNATYIDLKPDLLVMTISAGSSNSTVFVVNNTGEQETTVELSSDSNWLIFSEDSLDLNASESKEVTVTINVPDGTPPGEYEITVTGTTPEGIDASLLRITVPDEEPPVFLSLWFSDIISYGEEQTVTAEVVDNVAIDICLIDYGEGNISMDDCSYSWVPEEIGNISFTVYVNDTSGNWNSMQGVFTVVDDTAPEIVSWVIYPKAVIVGNEVSISVDAVDNYQLDSIWAVVQGEMVEISGEYKADDSGRYEVWIFANDTSGNIKNVSDYFIASEPLEFNGRVEDANKSGVEGSLLIYFPGTEQVISSLEFEGDFSVVIPDYVYDLKFAVFDEMLKIRLNYVNVSEADGKTLGLDRSELVEGYLVTYGIENPYEMSNATIVIAYSDLDYGKEKSLRIYGCEDWNFTARECLGDWKALSVKQNTTGDYFILAPERLSAFSVKELRVRRRHHMTLLLNVSCVNETAFVKVLGREEKPLKGADVDVFFDGEKIKHLRTNENGTAWFVPIEEGEYRVKVDKSGYYSEKKTVDIPVCLPETTTTTTSSSTTITSITTTTTVLTTSTSTTVTITSTTAMVTTTTLQLRETCFDGIQNQGEEGIDCGGPCKPCPRGIGWLWLIPVILIIGALILLLMRRGGRK